MPDVRGTIDKITPEIVALRHELHQHPEIRFEEEWTSDRVCAFLDAIGVPFERGYAKGTGIVATITGEGPGCVALRADIDALEIDEETDLPYASTIPNRMHACGHDGHTAILCGVAKTLSAHKDQLRGRVKLVFQPGEEVGGGGRFMVDEGAIDDVDAIFALHGWPTMPVGQIAVRDGCMMARAQEFEIIVTGKGCHAADPASGVDPVLVAAHITTALQSIVSRELNPWDSGVVTVGHIAGGSATNIIPETAMLRGTMRALNDATAMHIESSVQRIAQDVARAFRADSAFRTINVAYPPVVNDVAATDHVRDVARDIIGADRIVEVEQPYMGAEDFSFFLNKKPGSYFWIGVNPNEDEPYPSLHSPRYDFTDATVPIAIDLMANVAIRHLERGAAVHA